MYIVYIKYNIHNQYHPTSPLSFFQGSANKQKARYHRRWRSKTQMYQAKPGKELIQYRNSGRRFKEASKWLMMMIKPNITTDDFCSLLWQKQHRLYFMLEKNAWSSKVYIPIGWKKKKLYIQFTWIFVRRFYLVLIIFYSPRIRSSTSGVCALAIECFVLP